MKLMKKNYIYMIKMQNLVWAFKSNWCKHFLCCLIHFNRNSVKLWSRHREIMTDGRFKKKITNQCFSFISFRFYHRTACIWNECQNCFLPLTNFPHYFYPRHLHPPLLIHLVLKVVSPFVQHAILDNGPFFSPQKLFSFLRYNIYRFQNFCMKTKCFILPFSSGVSSSSSSSLDSSKILGLLPPANLNLKSQANNIKYFIF